MLDYEEVRQRLQRGEYRKQKPKKRLKIKPFFAWYDMWIGAYWDRKKRALYICLLPCCVIRIRKG
jgi:hypothetical protein